MDKKKVQGKDIVVNEVPVVGCLTLGIGAEQEVFYLVESRITPVDTYGVRFMVVPDGESFITDDGTLVFEYARAILVGIHTPWFLEYGVYPERILVEEYEIEN